MQNQNQKPQNTLPNVPTAPVAQGMGMPSQAGVANPVAQGAAPAVAAKSQQTAQKQAQQVMNQATSKAAQSAFVRKIVDKIRNSENILVALSRDPSVDEMAAAIGLTLFLDGLQKHTTAIYSGETPDALAFLQPEGTFEANTDSLRDFIIALSKDKADHLRYKLDGDFVKVFITPYKTTLSEDDLEFTYGDFNVNLVLGLGIPSAGDLDEALSEYGRIMHDATTVDITVDVPGKFAEIEWSDPTASSVSEMVTKLIFTMQGQDAILDKEVATALLTGIVAATGRFSNDKTNSDTMQLASKLMSMGADQQLISANVMDNDGNRPGDVVQNVEPEVDRTNLLVGQDYNHNNAVPAEAVVENVNVPQLTTATTVNESPVVAPVVPDLLKDNADEDRAAMRAAAAAAVNEAVASATASAAAAGATGVGVPVVSPQPMAQGTQNMPESEQPKDYAQMMAQALAETGGVATPAQPVMSQPITTAQTAPTGVQNVAPVAEPVAKNGGVVLPPPPDPTQVAKMMPPVLPGVQVPGAQDGAFKIPGA